MSRGAAPAARARRWPRASLAALALWLLLPGSATLPLLDRDEPRFARATVEMIQRGDWVIPTLNGHDRFDKPILTYWLMRAGYALAGRDELGARLHSIASALGLALVVFAFGRRLGSRRAALWAAAALLTSLQLLVQGRSATADMPMVLAVAVAAWAAWEIPRQPGDGVPWRWALAFYGALALGFLAKGPVALAVPLGTLALYRGVFWRERVAWRRFGFAWGTLGTLALVGAWGIPALWQTGGRFWQVGIGEHVIARGEGAFHGRSWVPFYYVATAFFSLFPWVAFAPRVARWLARGWDAQRAYLLSWFLAPQLIFFFYATQLPHYVLPGFPAFFLALGRALDDPRASRPWMRAWELAVLGGGVLIALAAAGAVSLADLPEPMRALRVAAWSLAGGVAALALFAAARGARAAAAAALLALPVCTSVLAAALRDVSPAVSLEPTFHTLRPGTELIGEGYREDSLVFYADHPWTWANDTAQAMARLQAPGPKLAVVQVGERPLAADVAWALRGRLGWARGARPGWSLADRVAPELAQAPGATLVEGLNPARASWTTLAVIPKDEAPER